MFTFNLSPSSQSPKKGKGKLNVKSLTSTQMVTGQVFFYMVTDALNWAPSMRGKRLHL